MGASMANNPASSLIISIFLMVVGLFLSTAVSVMAFYFKQLKKNIEDYRNSVESRMREGDERFEKLENSLIDLKTEVYKGYVNKEDFIRILGNFEYKFKEVIELIEKSFSALAWKGEKSGRD